jgi:hypothetical protein
LWAKGFKSEDIIREMFPVYGRKFLSRKAVHNCGKRFSDDEDVETEVQKCLRQQSKDW